MADTKSQQPVEFATLPKLPPPLAAHSVFQFLHDKVSAIDAEIRGAQSRKAKLRIITQTAAVHLTCLKLAAAIVVEEEGKDEQSRKAWTKALVKIVDRAQDVMRRDNVKENFSHYQVPRVLRVMVDGAKAYRAQLGLRAQSLGIMARDEADLRFALEHWKLIVLDLKSEPHEEILKMKDCEDNVAWFEATLAVALADKETKS